ncbi:Protein FAR1-RELATED SEQUENCE 5 [Glycine soja]|uniref:Protein FAR1-RELATED SEQUENCE 5 n=1 Tax=Glycine soja TaxID=3848 RepID=A0A445KD21_GLYSO|nr:Protein FAR1-RELATED SEQUENCE 5 [Glycine soja]
MSELESSDNFCSLVNGDDDNDVTEVYPNDDDGQHDVGLEDEDEVDSEVHNDDGGDYDEFWIPGLLKEECISIDSMVDIRQFDMEEITNEVVRRLDFGDLELAYQFYCWYAKISGFSVRKSHIVRNTCMETLQQTFVCSCAGYRRKKESMCGCEAMFDVHVHFCTRRWYVTCWNFDHNHLLLDLKLSCLLLGHRKMSASNIMQVENYIKVGIRPPHMYATFANQCGGYDKVGFISKDIYNEEGRMRKQHTSDASGALKYLHDLRRKDPMMYVSYTADEGLRLQRLFWCDTESQLLYEVFGDVLAFDAMPLIRKITMKGKTPCSIITDGDLAMRNAITRVMPGVFHRLCTWHLLHNALSHVRDKQVLKWLKNLMLSDFEVVEFEEKWKEMVVMFELEDNTWISPAHLRGYFFAGIRTTSRCEAFHAHVAKYVHSRTNLTDFVEQFQRCLTSFRYRVVMADYSSTYGNEVLQTNLRSLERSGDHLLTKEMFRLFQSYLCRTIKLRVVDCKEMATFSIYTVLKYCSGSVWLVSYCPSTVDFSCSCMRMQSIGLPCDHILVVLVSLNFMELPKYATLVEVGRQVCEDAYRDEDEYEKMLHFLPNEVRRLKSKNNSEPCIDDNDEQADQQGDNYDGCGQVGVDESGKQRRIQKCGQCGGSGHNKQSCTNHPRNANICVGGSFISSSEQANTMCQPTDEYNYELNYPLETYKWKHHSIIVDVDATLIAHDVLCHPCLTETYK